MSCIYFHSPSGTRSIYSTERSYFSIIISDLFTSSLGVNYSDTERNPHFLRKVIKKDHYCLREKGKFFSDSIRIACNMLDGSIFHINGTDIPSFGAALNTALAIGNDFIKLAARIHGQCEIHCYIEGKNRNWIASIIKNALSNNIFRSESGWNNIIKFLKSSSNEPVVLSYSVCEPFPNAAFSSWTPPIVDGEEDWDDYYEIPISKRWEMGMKAIRKNKKIFEISPDNWDIYYFDKGITGFDIRKKALEA